jgi:hypothetical protein
MRTVLGLSAVAVAFFLFGQWGWRHAEALVPISTSPFRRAAKKRQLRRGAACFMAGSAVLLVTLGARLFGLHYY